jgi:hypothetical protein
VCVDPGEAGKLGNVEEWGEAGDFFGGQVWFRDWFLVVACQICATQENPSLILNQPSSR